MCTLPKPFFFLVQPFFSPNIMKSAFALAGQRSRGSSKEAGEKISDTTKASTGRTERDIL